MARNATIGEHVKLAKRLVNSDGCSVAPDLWWRKCCDMHDEFYGLHADREGNPITRAEADKRFRHCLHDTAKTIFGRWFLSWVYWGAVRIFGRGYWNGEKETEDAAEQQ